MMSSSSIDKIKSTKKTKTSKTTKGSKKKVGGRQSGSNGYNDELVLKVADQLLPSSTDEWVCAAKLYSALANETKERKGPSLSRYWSRLLVKDFIGGETGNKELPKLTKMAK